MEPSFRPFLFEGSKGRVEAGSIATDTGSRYRISFKELGIVTGEGGLNTNITIRGAEDEGGNRSRFYIAFLVIVAAVITLLLALLYFFLV